MEPNRRSRNSNRAQMSNAQQAALNNANFNMNAMPQQSSNVYAPQQMNTSNNVFNAPNYNQTMAPPQQQQQMQFPVQQQMPYPVQPMTITVYGYVPNNIPGTFNDDEPFQESVKGTTKEGKVDVTLKAQRSQVKLGEKTIMPGMCSLMAEGGTRTSVDLICVIDVSGSMSGKKIQLVQETMKFLIETLTPSDRLSILTFNSSGRKICGLKTVTQENMVAFTGLINGLRAGGGTNIMSGMEYAFKTIRDRKVPNTVTSVFLLSDGQDGGADQLIKQALTTKENEELGVFSIHSFGFGNDHDEDLMTNIANLKDGAFYYIQELATLDEAFCNALGGIISLVANEVIVKVRLIAKDMLGETVISKVYGDKWEKVNDREYTIRLTQLMSGVSKDFVFELTFPAIPGEVGDAAREHVIMEAVMEAKGVQGQAMAGASGLSVTLINQNEEIAEVNENVDVIENYLRVKASEAIDVNMKMAEANQFEEAQKGLDQMIAHIQGSKRARKEKMEPLLNDLQLIRQKCQPQVYHQEGRKHMKNTYEAQSRQMNFQYSNAMQAQMVDQRRAMKKM